MSQRNTGRWLLMLWISFSGMMITATPVCAGEQVVLTRTPQQGLQPQAVCDATGTVHLVYFLGKPGQGDIFYVRRGPRDKQFSEPVMVNSQPGTAIAIGTIRGAQLAVGKNGRVHVVWNSSSKGAPPEDKLKFPLFYTRLADDGKAFEPQRNVISFAYGLDGGGSVAADPQGHVYIAWHANPARSGEASRKVYTRRSSDEGRTFSEERPAITQDTGACGCCGMKVFATSQGSVWALYRSAEQSLHRDTFLLASTDQARTFAARRLDRWNVATCPMSSFSLAEIPGGIVAAWETQGQIHWQRLQLDSKPAPAAVSLTSGDTITLPGASKVRKHPALAVAPEGQLLVAWTEGTGWERGGSLAWQVFDTQGRPTAEKGRAEGIPVWSFSTAFTRPDGRFEIIY